MIAPVITAMLAIKAIATALMSQPIIASVLGLILSPSLAPRVFYPEPF